MKKFRELFFIASLITLFSFPVEDISAQCPMCRMSVESNYKDGGTAGRGLNSGILYMLAMPYLLVGAIAFVWWKNQNTDEDELEYPQIGPDQVN